MTTKNYILEVAAFTVKPEFIEKLPEIRANFSSLVEGLAGLQSIQSYTPVAGSDTFVDVIKWDSMESAAVAKEMFENRDERVMPYMQAIEAMQFMGHFVS